MKNQIKSLALATGIAAAPFLGLIGLEQLCFSSTRTQLTTNIYDNGSGIEYLKNKIIGIDTNYDGKLDLQRIPSIVRGVPSIVVKQGHRCWNESLQESYQEEFQKIRYKLEK